MLAEFVARPLSMRRTAGSLDTEDLPGGGSPVRVRRRDRPGDNRPDHAHHMRDARPLSAMCRCYHATRRLRRHASCRADLVNESVPHDATGHCCPSVWVSVSLGRTLHHANQSTLVPGDPLTGRLMGTGGAERHKSKAEGWSARCCTGLVHDLQPSVVAGEGGPNVAPCEPLRNPAGQANAESFGQLTPWSIDVTN
jgi:hypothetical protein